jgi:hypothetical protein
VATRGVELGGTGRPDAARFSGGMVGVSRHGVGERELTGGAHASVRGEREDAEDGMRESKRKMYSQKYAKG